MVSDSFVLTSTYDGVKRIKLAFMRIIGLAALAFSFPLVMLADLNQTLLLRPGWLPALQTRSVLYLHVDQPKLALADAMGDLIGSVKSGQKKKSLVGYGRD